MNLDNLFQIDYDKLVVELLPTRMRKKKHIYWLSVLITPYKKMLQALKVFRAQSLYKIQHDARSGSIENVLNDSFDPLLREIRIKGAQSSRPTYLPQYTSFYIENNGGAVGANPLITHLPQYTPFYIYQEDEVSEFYIDFEVVIPQRLQLEDTDLIRLKSLVKYYALKDKNFKITYTNDQI